MLFFKSGQLADIKYKYDDISEGEYFGMSLLPAPFLAIYSLLKFFSLDPSSKKQKFYGWIFIIAVIFSLFFLLEFSSLGSACDK